MTTTQCGIQTDVTQLLRLLGPSMYKGRVLEVAVKELLQNSFDAVKKFPDGKIDILTSGSDNSIICIDNGVGMTSNTVKNVYLTIGGTLKEMDVTERSGGLGLAKVQFFLSASRLVVDTVRNGEHTILDCTQEELLAGKATLFTERTCAPNGTTVKLYYPKEVHQLDGSITCISMPWYFNILEKPLIGYPNVTVKHNGHLSCVSPSKFTHSIQLEFSWGYVDVLYAPTSYDPTCYKREAQVYSAGLYQFSKSFQKDIIGFLKFDAMINVRSKVAAGMAGYPFNNTREGFNVSVQQDINTISKYLFDIQSALNSEMIRKQFESLTSLEYTDVDGKAFERKTIAPGNNRIKYSDEFLSKLKEAFLSCSSVYEKKDFVQEAETRLAASKQDIDKLYGESLKLNNRTNGTYSCIDLFSKVSSVVFDTLRKCDFEENPNTPSVAGIIIEKHTGGCLTSGSINGIWINPFHDHYDTDPNIWVYDMMTTIIHEFAHIKEEYHGESHNNEMMNVAHMLISKGLYHKIEGKLRAIYDAHSEEIIDASKTFNASCNIL